MSYLLREWNAAHGRAAGPSGSRDAAAASYPAARQVLATELLAAARVGWSAQLACSAGRHPYDSVRGIEQPVHLVAGHDHGTARRRQNAQRVYDHVGIARVDAAQRFVGNETARCAHPHHSELCAPPLTAGNTPCLALPERLQAY